MRLLFPLPLLLASACTPAERVPLPWEREADYYVAHDILGHTHRPDARRTTPVAEHPQGAVELRTNAEGFRNDRSFAVPKPTGIWRAIVVGDSHTDGVVDNAEGFGDGLAQAITERISPSGPTIEVVNGGTGYWGPAQYGVAFAEWAPLAPDLCIVVLYEGNDFLDAVAAEERAGRRALPRIEDHYERLYAVTDAVGERVSQQLNQDLLFAHAPATAADAVLLTREALVAARDTCADLGAPLWVLRLPPSGAVHPPAPAEAAAIRRHLGPIPWLSGRTLGEETHRQLQQVVPDVRVVDGWQPLFRSARGLRARVSIDDPWAHTAARSVPARMFWSHDHHLSADGHAVLIERLADAITADGELP